MPFNEQLRELVTLAEAAVPGPRPPSYSPELVVCPWFRIGNDVVKTIGMAARFDPPTDITLDELRIELTYPQDSTADRSFRDQSRQAAGG